MQHSNLGEEI